MKILLFCFVSFIFIEIAISFRHLVAISNNLDAFIRLKVTGIIIYRS